MIDTWVNAQRNIYQDYVSLFGPTSDAMVRYVYFSDSTDTGIKIGLFIGGLYIYIDLAPSIADEAQLPLIPLEGQIVKVNATIYGLNQNRAVLYYRVNEKHGQRSRGQMLR